ncbi:Y-family DNA polymerase [Ochrobactrum quorumnocens]|uniref:DNA-directed DNA polymerase n=1 Tax=Ochrobactrum quorumnocens TaxID=271865 RepID=A0A5N1JTB4_9HYPH|nr:DNA polymerase Y family protein [[Ochrobactrum] quorumnocens]KAA9366590.1 DNA polymerase Y family protein [[Ochrobactrum] quorumnocens]MBD7992475.1 DNA polymerase Y family protein [Ochrobactrum gallinarum]
MKPLNLVQEKEQAERSFLALWFPFLPTDRLRRVASPEAVRNLPLVVTERTANALRVTAVDAAAATLGIFPGMALTDARARVEMLDVAPAMPERDAALVNHLAHWCERYTPLVAFDPLHGLMLDITGCAHLFGGLAAMRIDVTKRMERAGLCVQAAIADNAFAARLLARGTKGGVFDLAQADALLPRLPLSSLELAEASETGLKRAGLKRLGDVMQLPRSALTARFGPDLAAKLDRLARQTRAPISPLRMMSLATVEHRLSEPITVMELIEQILQELAQELFARLEKDGKGAVLIEASFFRVDGQVRHIRIETGQPLRDIRIFWRLARERLNALTDPLDAGFGFDMIRLAALRSITLAQHQTGLDQHEEDDAGFSQLIDRLSARLGPQRVLVTFPRDTHMPERAFGLRAALHSTRQNEASYQSAAVLPGDPPARPIKLFHPPQLIETTAEVPDSPPSFFIWRRVRHHVRLAEGPERIEQEWWLSIGQTAQDLRDYYRVEDEDGQRFWIFREGLYVGDNLPRWFLHGLFA